MTSVTHLGVPSLTGCVLVASLVFGGPAVSAPLAQPVADGPRSATVGTPPLPPSRGHIGLASWYGRRWQGRPTASGEPSDRHPPTAAHRTAPFGSQAVVTKVAHGHVVRVRITDRGPHTRHRILDLSSAAAPRLALVRTGAARVQVELLAASAPLA